MSNSRIGPCSNKACEASGLRVPLYGRDRLCRDCFTGREVKNYNYRFFDQDQIRQLVETFNENARKAKSKSEMIKWKYRAKRAMEHLPEKKCDAPGCDNMCKGEFCSRQCAGKTAGGYKQSRFYIPTKSSVHYVGPKNEINGEIDALFEKPGWHDAIQQPFPGA